MEKNFPALVPLQELSAMASAFAKSGLFGIKTPDQAMALMLIAQSEGLHPATAARDYHIINGKPSKTAEAMLRSFGESGGKVEWHELSNVRGDATFTHPQGGTLRIDWDMARAETAELLKNPMWKKYPRQMLRSRVVSEGVRSLWPAATGGMYVPEEVEDFTLKAPPKEVDSETLPSAAPAIAVKPQEAPPADSSAASSPPAEPTGLSDTQRAHLFALAADRDWTREQIKTFLDHRFKITSTKDLTQDQFRTLIQTVGEKSFGAALLNRPVTPRASPAAPAPHDFADWP